MKEKTTNAIDRLAPTLAPQEPIIMRQSWEHLLFLHWPIAPEVITPLLPPGLTLDTFDGEAYIALVPFTMRNIHFVGAPPVPGFSAFHEINVRTYVHHKGKDPGVWFFSLDAANAVAVAVARRFFHLPYFDAAMHLAERADGAIAYASRRRCCKPRAESQILYQPHGQAAPAAPGTPEFFFAERYILYAHDGQNLYRGRVHHKPYPLQKANLLALHDTLLAAAGVAPSPDANGSLPAPAFAQYARTVDVNIYPLRRL